MFLKQLMKGLVFVFCAVAHVATFYPVEEHILLYSANISATRGSSCRNDEFMCPASRQCIPLEFRCNNVNDCGDNSDENQCGKIA